MSQSAVPSDCQSPVRLGLPSFMRGRPDDVFCAATVVAANAKTTTNAPQKRFFIRCFVSESPEPAYQNGCLLRYSRSQTDRPQSMYPRPQYNERCGYIETPGGPDGVDRHMYLVLCAGDFVRHRVVDPLSEGQASNDEADRHFFRTGRFPKSKVGPQGFLANSVVLHRKARAHCRGHVRNAAEG